MDTEHCIQKKSRKDMIINKINVYGLNEALEGMRKPYLSKSTGIESDIDLAKKLIMAGTEHRKFLRQISIHIDMTASMTFWFEFDTYKIGVTSNSSSFWHTIGKQALVQGFHYGDFLYDDSIDIYFMEILETINRCIKENPEITKEQIRYLVPQGIKYNRSITITGEALLNMLQQRKRHRLKEWRDFYGLIHNNLFVSYKDFHKILFSKGGGLIV